MRASAGLDWQASLAPVLAQPGPSAAVPSTGVQQPEDPGGRGPDFGKSSPLGLLLLVVLLLAVVLLVRSMNKHLRRVQRNFGTGGQSGSEEQDPPPDSGRDDTPDQQ